MDETINAESKEEAPQKQPLSAKRIACEILAASTLSILALLVVYVTGIIVIDEGCFAVFGFLAMCVLTFPLLNGLGSAFGVYHVGSRGNETGSFLATLGFGFLGGLVMALLVCFVYAAGYVMSVMEKTVIWAIALLTAPSVATLCFNLTRRYKEPPSV